MKIKCRSLLLVLSLLSLPSFSQSTQPPFPVTLEKQLAERAVSYTEVSLDRKMLDFASKFMDKEDDAEGRRIIQKLNGIYVRTYDFDKPSQYTAADLENIRGQFQTPEWTALVRERSKSGQGDSDIYMKLVNGEVQGMFILDAEPKELDFVFISGPIRPEDLSDISGNFGILQGGHNLSPNKAEKQVGKETAK
jgi:hypothetical protein